MGNEIQTTSACSVTLPRRAGRFGSHPYGLPPCYVETEAASTTEGETRTYLPGSSIIAMTASGNAATLVLSDTLPHWYRVSALRSHPAWKTRALSEGHVLHLALGLFDDEAEHAVLGGNPGHVYTAAQEILTDISPEQPCEATSEPRSEAPRLGGHSRALLRFVAATAGAGSRHLPRQVQ
jgi:hypothetical protein